MAFVFTLCPNSVMLLCMVKQLLCCFPEQASQATLMHQAHSHIAPGARNSLASLPRPVTTAAPGVHKDCSLLVLPQLLTTPKGIARPWDHPLIAISASIAHQPCRGVHFALPSEEYLFPMCTGELRKILCLPEV